MNASPTARLPPGPAERPAGRPKWGAKWPFPPRHIHPCGPRQAVEHGPVFVIWRCRHQRWSTFTRALRASICAYSAWPTPRLLMHLTSPARFAFRSGANPTSAAEPTPRTAPCCTLPWRSGPANFNQPNGPFSPLHLTWLDGAADTQPAHRHTSTRKRGRLRHHASARTRAPGGLLGRMRWRSACCAPINASRPSGNAAARRCQRHRRRKRQRVRRTPAHGSRAWRHRLLREAVLVLALRHRHVHLPRIQRIGSKLNREIPEATGIPNTKADVQAILQTYCAP